MIHKTPKRKISKLPNREYPFPDNGWHWSTPPNFNAVCVECREAKRYMSGTNLPKCPVCNKIMKCVFCKTEIPRKTNDRGWKLLKKEII